MILGLNRSDGWLAMEAERRRHREMDEGVNAIIAHCRDRDRDRDRDGDGVRHEPMVPMPIIHHVGDQCKRRCRCTRLLKSR